MERRENIKNILFYSVLTFLTLTALTYAQSEIRLTDVEPGYVEYGAFTLGSDGEVRVSGTVAGFEEWGNETYFYGWILDANTRNVVWHLLDNRDVRDDMDDGEFVNFDEKVKLKAGNYEVYFTGARSSYDYHVDGVKGFLKKLFGSDKREYRRRYRDELYLQLNGVSGGFSVVDKNKFVDELSENAIASFIRAGEDEYQKIPFALSKETKLRIYAIGESINDRVYDYAWIYNASTYEKVWQMSSRRSNYAGGGDKNIMFDDDITLPAGNYYLVYVSDDSHSFEEWNVMPPDDPQFWGVTIWAASSEDQANVVAFNPENINQPFIEIVKVGDNQFRKQGFTLKKDMEIVVHAFGEGYDKRHLADQGWIVDAETGEKVWLMEKADIEYGGGAEKNRLVHETLDLKKGSYIVYYSTDGSHSYEKWNAAPPFDPERWGITLWAANQDDAKYVTLFDPDDFQSDKVIAQIVRVRENEYESKSFRIDKTQQVRIIAIGEGSDGRMYDYGWIENADTRTIIWEMTYRKTDHAGGASKNRKFEGTITLSPGNYKLYYETDGSHSYRDWNSTPPYNQEMYGISVLRVE